jgi:hypothetical protein
MLKLVWLAIATSSSLRVKLVDEIVDKYDPGPAKLVLQLENGQSFWQVGIGRYVLFCAR